MERKIIIALDPREGQITKVFTSDPVLATEVVVIDPEAPNPVSGPYDPKVTVVSSAVDEAATDYIKTKVSAYQCQVEPEEKSLALFTWRKVIDLWPYLVEQPEGRMTCVSVAEEPSRLFYASVLQHEGGWGASLLLDGVHEMAPAFSTPEQAQEHAECMLANCLRSCGLFENASPLTSFDEDPFYEVAALLTILLDEEMQIVHVSEYKCEWIAVCIARDGTAIDDYVFARDSDGFLARRILSDRLEVRS
ncbi:MAG TPA: hypothetical protein VFV38_39730 [Ktedonobacteraceae bacterium]|nr:hypothetical protein [Ktedonobacteraceae bacterium]